MKMRITEEQRQSSKAIYTIERSMLSDKLAGDASRPTGGTVELEKGDWSATLGVFSGEDDADFIGAWNDGQAFFGSVTWAPNKEFSMTLDYVENNRSGTDDALGYGSAASLSALYETPRWGILANFIYGNNGDGNPADSAKDRANRQGDFDGLIVMPWYWLMEDKLQLVVRYQYATSEETEGLRVESRYLRGHHDDPLVDINGGRGNDYSAYYIGLNYYLCGDNAKIMGGISLDKMRSINQTKKSSNPVNIDAITYSIAFRSSF
jgi:hypothetical protein